MNNGAFLHFVYGDPGMGWKEEPRSDDVFKQITANFFVSRTPESEFANRPLFESLADVTAEQGDPFAAGAIWYIQAQATRSSW